MDDHVDVVVIGGGIVGCSIALEIAGRAGAGEVFLFEKGPYLGDGTSTRNSYVIHAGIYYPEDSLKARFCVEGKHALYAFCERNRIPCVRTGKVIVAEDAAHLPELEQLLDQGRRNGVDDLSLLDGKALRAREPAIRAEAALLSPSTGVFDVAQWFRVAASLLYESGATVLKRTPVVGLEPKGDLMEVSTGTRGSVLARFVVNAAGLLADEVGNLLGNDFRIHPVRGDYFSVAGARATQVRGAVYPTPGTLGLGIHLTRLWDDTLLLGPDARRVTAKDDYAPLPVLNEEGDLDPSTEDVRRFLDSARSYFPALEATDLRLAHCGIRPSLRAPGETGFRDFRILWDPAGHPVIHLVGIDSPGLTASPAIARHVADMIETRR